MFTGIIETIGEVTNLSREGSNLHITIQSSISGDLRIDQSISHNGACLTVTDIGKHDHTVTVIDETLTKTSLGNLQQGSLVNLERSIQANSRFDGHIVQGHVDALGYCTAIDDQDGSWLFTFSFEEAPDRIVVQKGSVTIDGTSLTVVDAGDSFLSVAIIPYTFQNTLFRTYQIGAPVNLEFDIIGKYVQRLIEKQNR